MQDKQKIKMNGTNIIICADDFGLSPGVNRGIIEAAAAGMVSAVSCMSVAPAWEDGVKRLKLPSPPALGLHLCLTGLKSLTHNTIMPTFFKLLKLICLNRLPKKEIETEIRAQIDKFIKHTGKNPAFLDGHMHVHQLPGIKDIVIGAAREHGAWVRNTYEPFSVIMDREVCRPKTFSIAIPGGVMKTALEKAGIKTNTGFTGIYDFSQLSDYGKLTERFLRQIKDGTVFMVHPGYADEELAKLDPHTKSREKELAFLLSDEFSGLLKKNNIAIVSSL